MTPVICMITDRRRLHRGGADSVVRQVEWAARAGVHLVQVRERDLDARVMTGLVAACVAAVSAFPTRVVVNDRVDVALAAGAHGVHLRADSVAAERVRRIAPRGFLVGRSVHAVAEATGAEADGADYLIFGSVFETASKPGVHPAGINVLKSVVGVTSVPVLAVGGITADTAAAIGRTGAAGIAAIGLFADADSEKGVQEALAGLRKTFDSGSRRS